MNNNYIVRVLAFIKKHRFIKLITIIIFSIVIIKFVLFVMPLPRLTQFNNESIGLRLYDVHNIPMRFIPSKDGAWQDYIRFKDSPKFLRKIILTSEDKRFYFHFGFDPIAILRSFYINSKENQIVSGASTLSMQLARIIFPHKQNWQGKIYEIFMAIILESKKSKRWIFEQYINNIPFGYNVKGFGAASMMYFNKDINKLSNEQLVLLTIIPRSPVYYDPFTHKDNLKKSLAKLLSKMKMKTTNNKINQIVNSCKKNKRNFLAPHFTHYVLQNIKKYINDKKIHSIYKVKTTIDLKLQADIENIVRSLLTRYKEHRVTNASVLVIENKSGNIISYLGSENFFDTENSGQIDGVRIKNQPGSTLKPFLYALALSNGFKPNSILPDIELNLGGSENYRPHNYNLRYNGPVRLRVSLASSLNVPAVYLLNRIGVKNFITHLRFIGFDSISKDINPGIGLALGNSEVRLIELTRAFSIFPNSGILKPLVSITEVTTKKGTINNIYNSSLIKNKLKNELVPKQIYSQKNAFLIYDILSDDKSRTLGFGPSPLFGGQKIMLKTGTSNKYGNIWALCATKYYTIGVWAGNFNGDTIIGLPGASIPLEIASNILQLLDDHSQPIKPPEDLHLYPICSLSGKKPNGECNAITLDYFTKEEYKNLSLCDYHKIDSSTHAQYVSYPPLFVPWAIKKGVYSEYQKKEVGQNSLIILLPQDHSVFYIDPSENKNVQTVPLKFSAKIGGKPLFYKLNNGETNMLDFPYYKSIELKRGEYTLSVFTGDNENEAKSVTFIIK